MFCTKNLVLNIGFKDLWYNTLHIQIRLGFGLVNLIDMHLRINIFNIKQVLIEFTKPNLSLKSIYDCANKY